MRTPKWRKKEQGQALVELMVLIPILMLFIATALPLIVHGVAVPWLDERLILRQLTQDDEQIHHVLLLTHNQELLPPYFKKKSLKETTRIVSMGMPFTIPGTTFPGELTKKATTAAISKGGVWNRDILGDLQKQDQQISGDLTIITGSVVAEPRVAEKVKKLTLIGVTSGMSGILEQAGIKLLHLNLNAIPEPKKGE